MSNSRDFKNLTASLLSKHFGIGCILFLASCFATSLFQPVSGQDNSPVTFTAFYWNNLPTEDLYYRNGDELQLIEFRSSERSAEYELKSDTFKIYRKSEKETNQILYTMIGQSVVPANSKVMFIINAVESDVGKELVYEIFGVDDGLQKFPAESFKVVNFTKRKLTVECGEEKIDVEPENSNVINVDAREGGFQYFEVFDNVGQRIAGTRLFMQPHGRETIFISPPKKKGNGVQLKFITEVVQTELEEDESQ